VALWTNEGMLDSTRAYLAGGPVPAFWCTLYTNDVTPGPVTVWGDLIECVLPNYVRQPLVPATWTLGVAGGLVTSTYPTLTFTFGANAGGTTIYGFMVANTAGGLTRTGWGERFAVPYAVPAAGGTLVLDLSDYDQAR